MGNQHRNFDEAAKTWDDKPERVKLVNEIADTILGAVSISPDMDMLDFGCGTGLLTLRLQPLVRTIIGADSSRGMLDVLNAKISAAGLDNICSMHLDPERGDTLKGKYHLIVSSMTLHHIKVIEPLLAMFHAALVAGGTLCLADLDLDGGLFHEDSTGVHHNGFDRAILQDMLSAAGFTQIYDLTAAEIIKPLADGTPHSFSVFLIVAQK